MFASDWDDTMDDGWVFCGCGVTLMGHPGESDGQCHVCAGAPHERECHCDECETYWGPFCSGVEG